MANSYTQRQVGNFLNAQQKLNEINFNAMRTRAQIQYENRGFNIGYDNQVSQMLGEYANDIYWNSENPNEENSAREFARVISSIQPAITEEQAYQNYRNIIRKVTGDDMDASSLVKLAGQKVIQGLHDIGTGVSHAFWLMNTNQFKGLTEEEQKKKYDEETKRLEEQRRKYHRTDIYSDQFEGFMDKVVLSAADFLPSQAVSLGASVGGIILSYVTANPLFATAGHIVSGVAAGLMEGGSAAMEAHNAGADIDTERAIFTGVGLVNGTLEWVGNLGEDAIAKAMGEVIKLNKAVNGLGKVAINKTVRQIFGEVGTKFAINMITEPATEGLQEWTQMYAMNLAAKWEEQNRGKKWSDDFTYTPEEMGNAVWETIKSTMRGQLLLGVVGSGSELMTRFARGDMRMVLNANKYTKSTDNSVAVNANAVLGVEGKVNVPKVETTNKKGEKVTVDDTFSPIKGYEANDVIIPTTQEEAAEVQYIKNKNDGKTSAINVEIVKADVSGENASVDEAKRMALQVPEKILNNEITVMVGNDGTIQVNKDNLDMVSRMLVAKNYKNFGGIEYRNGDYNIKIGDKVYRISSTITSDAQAVTAESYYADMEKEKRTGQYSLATAEGQARFLSDLQDEFTKQGLKDSDLVDAVNNSREMVTNWQDSIGKFVDLIKASNPDQDVETLKNDVTYGTVAMVAKFMPIVGKDMAWAKDSIVIDDTLESGVDSKGEYGGYSYWTDGDGNRVKNYSEITNHEGEKFHIALSKLMNATTGIHEVGHMALSMNEQRFLNDDYFKSAFYDELKADNAGVEDERQWKIGEKTHEAFASKLETYVETGVAENKQQASLFNRIIDALKAFADSIRHLLTGEQLEFYDRLFDDENHQNTEEYEQTEADSAENSQNEADLFDNNEQTERFQRVDSEEGTKREVDTILADIQANPEIYRDEQGNLLAPNGKVSNLDEYTYALVRTPNFINWFGDWINDPENASKILDENGEPMVVYHGSEVTDIEIFNDNYSSVNGGVPGLIYATPDMVMGKTYAHGGMVYELFMNMRNPLDFKNLDSNFYDAYRQWYIDYFTNKTKEAIADFYKSESDDEIKARAEEMAQAHVDEIKRKVADNFSPHWEIENEFYNHLSEYGYDGYIDKFLNEYAVTAPNQIKSTDNNGNFSVDDPAFRHQRFFEVNSIDKDLEEGKMVNYHELTRYRKQSDWVKAEQLASKIAATGKYEWMSTLLNNCIAEVKGTGDFLWEEITEDDWKKITALWQAKGNEYAVNDLANRNAQPHGTKIIKSDLEEFQGKDVTKVLKRLLAWNLNTNETSAMRRWIQQYTGKSGITDEQNVLNLARRMDARGFFNDRVAWPDGTIASKKYRYLDMVQQTAYGTTSLELQEDGTYKKVSTDKNYRSTRVKDAYWKGALAEIEDNAGEIRAIDHATTITPVEGSEQINGAAIEDNELSLSIQNLNEKEVKKAKRETKKVQKRLETAREELKQLRKLKSERDELENALREGARSLNMDESKYTNLIDLANAIKEEGSYINATDQLLNEYNLNHAIDLEQQIQANEQKVAELEEEVKDLNRDKSQLEIRERRLTKKVKDREAKISSLVKDIKDEKVISSEQASEIKSMQKDMLRMVYMINNMSNEADSLFDELARSYRDLEQMNFMNKDMDYMTEELGKANERNENLSAKLKAIREELGATYNEIQKIQAIKNRIAELEKANLEYRVEASKRRWKARLTSQTGDPIRDKYLSQFARAFFRNPDEDGAFIPTKLSQEVLNALAEEPPKDATYKDGVPIPSIYEFLNRKGFLDGDTLVKGFYDLPFKEFKGVWSIINEAKKLSKELKDERTAEEKRQVNYITEVATEGIGEIELSEKDMQKAVEGVAEGKYKDMDEAKKAITLENLGNPGTIKNDRKKKSIFFNKKFNANNNILYNSFTSFYNLMYKISPEFRDLMFFGNEEQKIKGLNQIYNDWYKAQNERTGYVDNVLLEELGSKKAVEKFQRDVVKQVEIKMLDDKSAVTPWLAKQQTWQNFAQYDTPDDTVNTSFTLEEAFAIYEHAKQNEDIAHILGGNKVNAWQMAWVVQQFEEENGVFHQYKKIADAYQHAYEMAWDRFQKVANDVFGIAITKYEFYSPANNESLNKDTSLSLPFNFGADGEPINPRDTTRLKKSSAMNEKLGGKNSIKLQYVTDFGNIVSKQEWLIQSAGFWKMWDDIMRNDGGGVRLQIANKYGADMADTVIKSMKAISNPEFSDVAHGLNKFLNWMRNNSALANLGFSLSSTIQQPAVFFLGCSKFGVKNMVSALGSIKQHGGIKAFINYVHEASPQVKHSGDTNIMYAEQAIKNSKFLKSIGLAQDIARFGMRGIEFLDRINRCIMWEAGRMYYAQKDSKMSAEQVNLRATQDVMNMNSSRQAKDNSLAYNSKNPLFKALLMFTNQLNKQWNMLIGEDGIGAIKRHEYSQFVATVVGMAFASTWVLLAKGKLLNTPEDKKWYEDVMKDYFSESISVIPVVGDKISDFINGYNYIESDIVTSMANLVKQVMAEDTGKKGQKVRTAAKDAGIEFMEFLGAPKVPVKNTYSALFENGQYVGDEFFTGGRWARTILPRDWFEYFEGLND